MTTPPVPSITDEQLAEIEQEALMATPGPWEQVGIHVHTKLGAENRAGSLAHHRDGWNIATVNPWPATNADGEDEDLPVIEQMANRAHIANCDPSTVLALIARLRAAEVDAQDLREKLRSANASLEASYGYCKQYRDRMESAEDKLSAIRTLMERNP